MKLRNKSLVLKSLFVLSIFWSLTTLQSCGSDDDSGNSEEESEVDCDQITLGDGPGDCDVNLSLDQSFTITENTTDRVITTNSIPDHMVGDFPNADISEQNETYTITLTPIDTGSLTSLLGNDGPVYSFGVLLSGVELDPVAAEPWPHSDLGIMDPDVNWDWNLEATNVPIGLDCNYAHVQPTGKYHYHGAPTLETLINNASTTEMTLVGWAADGFPIYYKYAYSTATDASSSVVSMTSSYQIKTGNRTGDGITGPCSAYNGAYFQDYEYVDGLGTLDEANGRTGVTPEFPNGTFYYVLTDGDEFPSIPRYFKGTPSNDFKLGPGN